VSNRVHFVVLWLFSPEVDATASSEVETVIAKSSLLKVTLLHLLLRFVSKSFRLLF
jgi:hypothetical protein